MKTRRREFLSTSLLAGAALSIRGSADAGSNPIAVENAKPGTRDWMLTKPRIDPAAKYRCPWIEGYCSQASIRTGEEITFHVSTNPAAEWTLEIYRLGYYQGHGGRLMRKFDARPGKVQPDPPVGEKRLRHCTWEPGATLKIPDNWLSGVYLGKLTELTNGTQSCVIFIVRDDRRADFLFQCSDHTWQAYNRWPDKFALYNSADNDWYWGPGVQVSFHRPYGKYCQILDAPLSTGSGEFLLWEFPLAFWLEQHGYDITYISNQDTHHEPAGLLRAKGFLSVGHDEYWTIEMFRNLQAAIARGVSAAFLSGNAVCGRILFDQNPKIPAFERVGVFGPPGGTQEFDHMKDLAHERPYAHELTGAHSTGPVTGGADWTCALPDHWLFKGTGMKKGDSVPGLVGWEYHGDPAPIPGLEIVATGPTQSAPGKPNGGTYTATIYPGPKNNIIFNAATIWWADALSAPPGYVRPSVYTSPKGPDTRVQQIMQNLLERVKT